MTEPFCFNYASELFEKLTSRGGTGEAVYRGHGDSMYQLVPSFQREGYVNKFLSLDDASVLTASSSPFRAFYQTANQMGLSLPSVSNEKHQNYTSESPIDALMDVRDEFDGEYDADDLEIMAFAQHYGIPTPLLDWSRSPLVAMYFAASGALDAFTGKAREYLSIDQVLDDQVPDSVRQKLSQYGEKKYLSVWQANSFGLNELSRKRLLFETDIDDKYSVCFFTPKNQGNQNIIAQQGLFSIHRPIKMTGEFRYGETPAKSLSEVLDEHLKWLDAREGQSQFLRESQQCGMLNEFKLPVSQAVELLNLLGSCGIHAASVYPGHQGCAKRVRERADISLIDRLFNPQASEQD
ncbi:FRG domain-containing protein [Sulfitobacter sp. HNIBRBA2951]|uniref:FRG domain-containing protein n=1 Tax=Sulfitobacter aquimarinus TaxID=3158557 RepID=UPI0032E00BE1